jgi:hypothetical protein
MCFDNVYNSIFEFWYCTWNNILCFNLFVHLGDPWDMMSDHLTRLFKQSKVEPNSTWLRHWKNTRLLQKWRLWWTHFCATWCWCWLFATSRKWPFSTKQFSTTCFQLCSNCKFLHLKNKLMVITKEVDSFTNLVDNWKQVSIKRPSLDYSSH